MEEFDCKEIFYQWLKDWQSYFGLLQVKSKRSCDIF